MPWDYSREPRAWQENGSLALRGTQLTAGFAYMGGTFGFYSFFIFSFCFFHCPQLWGPGFASAITGCSAPSCPAHPIPHPCLATGCPVVPCWGDGTLPPSWPPLSSSQTGVEVRVPAPPLLPSAPCTPPAPASALALCLPRHRGHLGCGCPGHRGWHTALHPPPSELPQSPGLVERLAAGA